MDRIPAAALQLGPASDTIAATTDRILALMEGAAATGVTLAVLPELALSPYFAAKVQDVDRWTDPVENARALRRIEEAAAGLGMATVASFAERTAAGLYNSMAFIGPDGARTGLFRKIHIPGTVEPDPAKALNILEKRYFLPGDLGFGTFRTGPVMAGGLICYDRRFPESWRSLMMAGAELFCAAYNTPVMPGNTLAEARRQSELAICGGAYSNATHAIAAGKAGLENGHTFIGGSFICGPDGAILAQATTMGDEVITAEIDLAAQRAQRRRWNFEVNRKPAEYRMDPPALDGAA